MNLTGDAQLTAQLREDTTLILPYQTIQMSLLSMILGKCWLIEWQRLSINCGKNLLDSLPAGKTGVSLTTILATSVSSPVSTVHNGLADFEECSASTTLTTPSAKNNPPPKNGYLTPPTHTSKTKTTINASATGRTAGFEMRTTTMEDALIATQSTLTAENAPLILGLISPVTFASQTT